MMPIDCVETRHTFNRSRTQEECLSLSVRLTADAPVSGSIMQISFLPPTGVISASAKFCFSYFLTEVEQNEPLL